MLGAVAVFLSGRNRDRGVLSLVLLQAKGLNKPSMHRMLSAAVATALLPLRKIPAILRLPRIDETALTGIRAEKIGAKDACAVIGICR